MSEEQKQDETPKRHRLRSFVLWGAGGVLGLLVILLIAASWYTTTADFQRRVGGEVVNVLEDSVGGRVEIGHISFSLWHLAIEVDNLVIHGTEPAGEAPYLSAKKIYVRVRINTFLSHTVGKGAQSHIGLNYLGVVEPHVHLIIDKDGNTNQPTPRRPSTSTEPVQNTLLDLQAKKVEITQGLAVVNDKAVPFNVRAD
ncbi:MAG: translocation/assembly module TamB, partial [Bryocella sp.]